MKVNPALKKSLAFASAILLFFSNVYSSQLDKWHIVLSAELATDEAINVAINDLNLAGASIGIEFIKSIQVKNKFSQAILVGSPERNEITRSFLQKNKINLSVIDNEQGFEIITQTQQGNKIIIVSGGSILGDVYGLFWILVERARRTHHALLVLPTR